MKMKIFFLIIVVASMFAAEDRALTCGIGLWERKILGNIGINWSNGSTSFENVEGLGIAMTFQHIYDAEGHADAKIDKITHYTVAEDEFFIRFVDYLQGVYYAKILPVNEVHAEYTVVPKDLLDKGHPWLQMQWISVDLHSCLLGRFWTIFRWVCWALVLYLLVTMTIERFCQSTAAKN